ncbi:MAG: hypothetical protein K8T20_06740 [Planctomycetes bacterium]|nr:hypothetical protein [Planctomycetota bacterium]
MKTLIAIFSTLALMAGVGTNEAKAENFFKKVGRSIRNAHERHVDMAEDLLEAAARHHDDDRNRGHYETREIQEWVAGSERIVYVEVQEPGHFEFRQVTEIVSPARCEKFYVEPVFRIERDCHGNQVKIMVKCGYWSTREIPAVSCTKTIKVWVEGECKQVAKKICVQGHFETKCVRVWVCD